MIKNRKRNTTLDSGGAGAPLLRTRVSIRVSVTDHDVANDAAGWSCTYRARTAVAVVAHKD